MADGVFNISKGAFVYYCGLPAASDAILVIPVLAAGLEADDALNNHDTVLALFAAANDEATAGGWNRKTITSVTVTVDDTANRVDVDIADQTWTAVAAANNTGKLLMAYDPDTGTGTDSTVIPLTYHDFTVTTDGTDVVAQIAAAGFGRAQ